MLSSKVTLLSSSKQKSFAKRKRMKAADYYNLVAAILSQGCSTCDEGGRNILTCMFRKVGLNQL